MIDWKERLTSFDHILTQEATVTIFEDILDIPFNKLINSLFEVEIDSNKFIVESKEIMEARCTKATQDLQEVKTTVWPTKREIYVWEAIGEMNALSEGSS